MSTTPVAPLITVTLIITPLFWGCADLDPGPDSARPSSSGVVDSAPPLSPSVIDSAKPLSFSVRDSAGVEIVESHARLWGAGEGWTLSPDPTIDLGDRAGDERYTFSRITGGVLTEMGGLAVTDALSREIRVFSSDGNLMHRLGGAGEGPGEFAAVPTIALLPGDALAAFDDRSGRLTTFASGGELLRELPATALERFALLGAHPVAADKLLASPPSTSLSVDYTVQGLQRSKRALIAIALTDAMVDTFAVLPGDELFVEGSSFGGVPFGRALVNTARADRIVASSQDGLAFSVWDERPPRLVLKVRVPDYPLSLSEEELRAEWTKYTNPAGVTDRDTRLWTAIGDRRTRPGLGGLLLDDEANVWAARYAGFREDPTGYEVFDRTGRWLGSVSVPSRTKILDVAFGSVLLRARGEYDEETARVYRIEKGGG